MYGPQFAILLSMHGHSGCLHLLVVVMSAAATSFLMVALEKSSEAESTGSGARGTQA